jgi:hypothetical protein
VSKFEIGAPFALKRTAAHILVRVVESGTLWIPLFRNEGSTLMRSPPGFGFTNTGPRYSKHGNLRPAPDPRAGEKF